VTQVSCQHFVDVILIPYTSFLLIDHCLTTLGQSTLDSGQHYFLSFSLIYGCVLVVSEQAQWQVSHAQYV